MKNLGIIGGGQLAMMICQCAKKYNIPIECLDPNKNCSASKYSNIIVANYDNEKMLTKLFKNNDYISYEFENISLEILQTINEKYDNKCLQDIYPLFLTNNRLREKTNLNNLMIKTNMFSIITKASEIKYFLKLYKSAIVIKTTMLGYDGKGQAIIRDINDSKDIKLATNLIAQSSCIVEQFVAFKYEVSLTGVYYGDDNFYFLPLNKNLHQKGILFTAETFLNTKLQIEAENIFKKLAKFINKKTIYTIEFFVTANNELYVNEIAPRVHNSSHHGIENYNVSQYDIFLSLFYTLNLPKLKILNDKILINVLGQHYHKIKDEVKKYNNVIFHDYFKKEVHKNRKMGHLIIDKQDKKTIEQFKKWCEI